MTTFLIIAGVVIVGCTLFFSMWKIQVLLQKAFVTMAGVVLIGIAAFVFLGPGIHLPKLGLPNLDQKGIDNFIKDNTNNGTTTHTKHRKHAKHRKHRRHHKTRKH